MKEIKKYQVRTRSFNASEWICGDDIYLSTAENIKGIPNADWIWSQTYARVYLRKYFEVSENQPVSVHFICDNAFSLYLNGKEVCENVTELDCDVTEYVVTGRNRLNIRAYQTADFSFFTSAICGEIKVGDKSFYTDRIWENYLAASFWDNSEPDNWQELDFEIVAPQTCHMHPRLYKRSLFMRRRFTVTNKPIRAVLYTASLGLSEMYLNGCRTDNEVFSQGISQKYREYHAVDVTHLIQSGENVLGAITANGWYNSESHSQVRMNKPCLRAELELIYREDEGERVMVIGTDGEWLCRFSPYTDNDIQFGERYDARLELIDWCIPTSADDGWHKCATVSDDDVVFTLRSYPPVVIKRRILPCGEFELGECPLFDFGENCAGRYRIVLKRTHPGQRIVISLCERLDKDGNMLTGAYTPVFFNRDAYDDGKSSGCMRNFDLYICRGGDEVYEPHFTFTGYRYLSVSGLDCRDQLVSVEMTVMHNDIIDTGSVTSSYPLVEKLFDATRRTWLANIINGPMDCPTREKNYWTGDSQLFCQTACYLSDCSDILARWTDGGRKMCPNVSGWGDEVYIIPYTLYRFYGDKELLRVCYPDILKFAEERLSDLENGLPRWLNSPFNDHLSPWLINVSGDFFGCAYFCYMLKMTAEIAEILGDSVSVKHFKSLSEAADRGFNEKFYLTAEERYTPSGQSGYVLPLAFGIVPQERRVLMAEKLNHAVLEKGSLDTGYAGTRYIMSILCEYGYYKTAFMLLDRKDFPSWNYMLSQGGNTITETWHGIEDMSDEGSISMNHFTLGSVTGWMFNDLCGIRWEESSPGFSKSVLRPVFISELGDISAEFDTVSGRIRAGWTVDGGMAYYTFDTPTHTTVILPDGSKREFESGKYTVQYRI